MIFIIIVLAYKHGKRGLSQVERPSSTPFMMRDPSLLLLCSIALPLILPRLLSPGSLFPFLPRPSRPFSRNGLTSERFQINLMDIRGGAVRESSFMQAQFEKSLGTHARGTLFMNRRFADMRL